MPLPYPTIEEARKAKPWRVKNLQGRTFGRLVVLRLARIERNTGAWWTVQCQCGRIKEVIGARLQHGDIASCGCGQREAYIHGAQATKTHGMKGTPTYRSWLAMRQRTMNPHSKDAKRYLHRGITMCERWRSFEAFLADMGVRPPGTSLARKDNQKGYTPENCRWETPQEQARNRRNNHMLEWQGKRQTLGEWERELGMKKNTLLSRLRQRWSIAKAFTTPVQTKQTAGRNTWKNQQQ